MEWRRAGWSFAALMLALVVVRVWGLEHYPAAHPDEGFWSAGARNFVLFGQPCLDGRLHPFLSPANFVALSGYFVVAPINLWTMRLFSVLTALAGGVLVWQLGRRWLPRRPWLFLLLYAFSSFTILIQRIMLLEAHQMFWLLLAASLWLGNSRRAMMLAGAAYGMALLVKSNSLYLLPAFVLSLPQPRAGSDPPGISAKTAFSLLAAAMTLVAGTGTFAAWALDPPGFTAAFDFEIAGRHFVDEGVLFHVGRFGLHPGRVGEVLRALVLDVPLTLPLAALAIAAIVRRPRAANRADRLFAAWVLCGMLFHLGQIYPEHRYLTTLAPAFLYLAASTIDRLLNRAEAAPSRWFVRPAYLVLLAFVGYHSLRVGMGALRTSNDPYWQAVRWVRQGVPANANVLAAPYLGVSLPHRSNDFYRTIFPYDPGAAPHTLAEVVQRHRIDVIVVDPEWRSYARPDWDEFVAGKCRRLAAVGDCEVYAVQPALLTASR